MTTASTFISTGSLRHPISIEFRDEVVSPTGHRTANWKTHRSGLFASIEPMNGRELLRAQQIQSTATHQVVLHWVAGVTSEMRIRHDQRLLNIEYVGNPTEKNRKLVLLCRETL